MAKEHRALNRKARRQGRAIGAATFFLAGRYRALVYVCFVVVVVVSYFGAWRESLRHVKVVLSRQRQKFFSKRMSP